MKVFAVGDSMCPVIKNGDIVSVENDNFNIRVGNCYVIRYRNKFLIHRVVSVSKRKVLLIGDNANAFQSVLKNRIFGEVSFWEPYLYRSSIVFFNKLYAVFRNSYIIRSVRSKVLKLLTGLFYGKREI